MSGPKVLVIGAGGYVGRRVMEEFHNRGITAVGADLRLEPGIVDEALDIRFPDKTLKVVHKVEPAVIVSLSYLLTMDLLADPQNGVHTNVLGVNGIFEAAARLNVPRVVFASSNAVYGDQSDFGDAEVFEDSPRNPRVMYAWMKQFNENMAGIYNNSTSTKIVSLILSSLHGRNKGGIFNPFDMLVEAAGSTDRITLPWSATHEFSFVHVDDAANMFVELALAPQLQWTTYNSGGEFLTMRRLAEIAGPLCELTIDFEEPGRQLAHCSRINADRLHSEVPALKLRPAQEWVEIELKAKESGPF